MTGARLRSSAGVSPERARIALGFLILSAEHPSSDEVREAADTLHLYIRQNTPGDYGTLDGKPYNGAGADL